MPADTSYFLIASNMRCGSSWLLLMLGELDYTVVDYEFKWRPPYQTSPVHYVLSDADSSVLEALKTIDSEKTHSFVGSKLTFDLQWYLRTMDYRLLAKTIESSIRIIHIVRDYRSVMNSCARGVQHLSRDSENQNGDSMYYRAIKNMRDVTARWSTLPEEHRQKVIPFSKAATDLWSMVRNDWFISSLAKTNPYYRVEYNDISKRLTELAHFIGHPASSDRIREITQRPPTLKLPPENVIMNRRTVHALSRIANFARSIRMAPVDRAVDPPESPEAISDTFIESMWRSVSEIEEAGYKPWLPFIQISSVCNMKCTMCQAANAGTRGGFMERGLYERILRELADWGVDSVCLASAQGEALLHPEALDYFQLAASRGFRVVTSTNGMALDEESIERLAAMELHTIQYSFCGFDKDSYERIYVGGNFEKASKNLSALWNAIRQTPCKLIVNGIVPEGDDELAGRTAQYVISLGIPGECLSLTRPWGRKPPGQSTEILRRIGRPAVCRILSDNPGIYVDGRVTGCGCTDYRGTLLLGDMKQSRLREIRTSETFRSYVRAFGEGRFKSIPLCAACDVPFRDRAIRVDATSG